MIMDHVTGISHIGSRQRTWTKPSVSMKASASSASAFFTMAQTAAVLSLTRTS